MNNWPGSHAQSNGSDWTRWRAEQAATEAGMALRQAEQATVAISSLDKRVSALEAKAAKFERWAAYALILLLLAAQVGPEAVLKIALKTLGGI